MAKRQLPSQEVLRQLLDYDPETGVLRWKERGPEWFSSPRIQRSWNAKLAGKEAFNSPHGNGYLSGAIFRQKHFSHRIAWKWMHGRDPDNIDHVNGDRSDNRIANLRSVSKTVNSRNLAMNRNNTSGHLGVSFDRESRRWDAYIWCSNRKKSLGAFLTKEAAIEARKAAEASLGYHKNHGRAA